MEKSLFHLEKVFFLPKRDSFARKKGLFSLVSDFFHWKETFLVSKVNYYRGKESFPGGKWNANAGSLSVHYPLSFVH